MYTAQWAQRLVVWWNENRTLNEQVWWFFLFFFWGGGGASAATMPTRASWNDQEVDTFWNFYPDSGSQFLCWFWVLCTFFSRSQFRSSRPHLHILEKNLHRMKFVVPIVNKILPGIEIWQESLLTKGMFLQTCSDNGAKRLVVVYRGCRVRLGTVSVWNVQTSTGTLSQYNGCALINIEFQTVTIGVSFQDDDKEREHDSPKASSTQDANSHALFCVHR